MLFSAMYGGTVVWDLFAHVTIKSPNIFIYFFLKSLLLGRLVLWCEFWGIFDYL